MYILFTDETNTDSQLKFFVYGGLIIPFDKFLDLDKGIDTIRKKYNYEATDSLKFNTSSKPKNITSEQFAKLKNEVIQLCIELKCLFLSYIVLHEIARKQGINKTIKWGADHIVGKFNYYLKTQNSKGIVIMDRLSNVGEYDFLSEKFTQGLVLKDKKVPLENIRIFTSSCNNASNLSSATDIVLGSFRYCINEPFNKKSAKTMMLDITTLIWGKRYGKNNKHIDPFEQGLTLRPNTDSIIIPHYKKEYDNLIAHINSLLE